MSTVLFAPHNDDETLFAAFTVLRYQPHVVVCFPSAKDYGPSAAREAETRAAMAVLGAAGVEQWQGDRDPEAQMRALDARLRPGQVFAPSDLTHHPDHLAVAAAAARVFGDRLTTYHTYMLANGGGPIKVTGREVLYAPEWLERKMRALLCYETQVRHPRAHVFFAQDLREYYGGGDANGGL